MYDRRRQVQTVHMGVAFIDFLAVGWFLPWDPPPHLPREAEHVADSMKRFSSAKSSASVTRIHTWIPIGGADQAVDSKFHVGYVLLYWHTFESQVDCITFSIILSVCVTLVEPSVVARLPSAIMVHVGAEDATCPTQAATVLRHSPWSLASFPPRNRSLLRRITDAIPLTTMTPTSTPVSGRSADLWSDLLLACLVIFVVLAPSFFFRVPERIDRPTSAKKAQ